MKSDLLEMSSACFFNMKNVKKVICTDLFCFVSVSAIDRDPGSMGKLDYNIPDSYHANIFRLQPSSSDPNVISIIVNK